MLLAALAFILVLAGCQQGGQGDADTEEIHAHIGEVQTRLETVEEQVMSLAEGEAIATEAQEELAAAQATLAQVDERLTPPLEPEPAAEPGLDAPAPTPPENPGF